MIPAAEMPPGGEPLTATWCSCRRGSSWSSRRLGAAGSWVVYLSLLTSSPVTLPDEPMVAVLTWFPFTWEMNSL